METEGRLSCLLVRWEQLLVQHAAFVQPLSTVSLLLSLILSVMVEQRNTQDMGSLVLCIRAPWPRAQKLGNSLNNMWQNYGSIVKKLHEVSVS
jgi:hypothetical protein